MRWLFLLVLLLNGVYLLSQLGSSEMSLYEDIPRLTNVEPIVLVREIDHGEKELLKEELDDVASDVEQLNDVSKAPLKEESDDVASDVEQLNDVSKASFVEGGQCFALGPFHQKGSLQELKSEVAPYVVNAVIRDKKGQDYTMYWVYIHPEKNYKDIVEVGKRLKTKKIKDFYLIRAGEKNNGISLGHFRDKQRALRLEAKVKKHGFDVHVEPISRTAEVFWLEYELIDQALPREIVNRYTQSADTVVSRLSRDCDS